MAVAPIRAAPAHTVPEHAQERDDYNAAVRALGSVTSQWWAARRHAKAMAREVAAAKATLRRAEMALKLKTTGRSK